MKKFILSLTAVALTATLQAATTTDQWTNGEIMLGLYSGVETQSFMVNLGSFEQFVGNNGATISFSSVNTADIASVFGASWATRTNLTWAVGGSIRSGPSLNGLTRNTIFATTPSGNVAITASTDAQQGAESNDFASIANSFDNAQTLSNGVTVSVSSANVDSFYGRQITSPTVRFGLGNNGIVGTQSVLDFYGLVPTSGGVSPTGLATDGTGRVWTRGTNALGSFTLNGSGLSFTAVPEPSSFAAIGGLLALGFAVSRRRRAQA